MAPLALLLLRYVDNLQDKHEYVFHSTKVLQGYPVKSDRANDSIPNWMHLSQAVVRQNDVWKVAAKERSPLFSCTVPYDAVYSVSAYSVRWSSTLPALSAGYA